MQHESVRSTPGAADKPKKRYRTGLEGPDIISAEGMRLTFIAGGIDEDMKMNVILSTPDTLLE